MISQISGTFTLPQGAPGQSAPAVDIKPKPASAPVELPGRSVAAVEKADDASVRQATERLNALVQQFDRNLQFTLDEDTNIRIVKVVDTQSEEVIRQIPSEEVVAIAQAIGKLQGMLVRDKA